MKAKIREAEARVVVLQNQLAVARDELRQLMLADFEERYGLRKGCRVKWQERGKEVFGVVEVIEVNRGWERPWVKAFKINKDGRKGHQLRRLYSDWEVADG